MRYEIGKMYPFVRVAFKMGQMRWGALFCPWLNDTLIAIRVVWLRCAEHHKVPELYGDHAVKNNDGFIFEQVSGNAASMFENVEEKDRRWANQYPHSHDEQLSDAQNRIVRRIATDEENAAVDQASPERIDYMCDLYTDASHHLCEVYAALHGGERRAVKFDTEKDRETFIAHFEELKRDILACAPMPMTVAINPYEYTIGGVKKTLEGHYSAVFSPQ